MAYKWFLGKFNQIYCYKNHNGVTGDLLLDAIYF